VLNDTWVSVPVGSEDNYSFKHMRKNQYEEALFKCEDERFEVDMVIDSNAAAIAALEPLAQEIHSLKAAEESRGGAQRFQYKLDKRSLGVIHLNAIIRIYGDHGAEILELLKKNPAGSIPIILKRLKQKDIEWRKARQELNKQWKEIQEKNWHKSLDHRSFYFKQTDKKQCSQRVLVQEIKEKRQEMEASADPVPEPFLMRPHLKLKFPKTEVHRDCLRVLMFAAENSGLSTLDKERIIKLFRSFLQPFFCLPEDWVPQPSADGEGGPAPSTAPSPAPTELRECVLSSDEDEDGEDGEALALPVLDPGDLPALAHGQQLLYSTQGCYFFLRLYHIFSERLQKAQELCEAAKDSKETMVTHPLKALTSEGEGAEDELSQYMGDGYKSFLSLLYAVVDGTLDSSRFEDGCRQLAGNNAFMLYTLDKVTAQLLKQAQHLAADPVAEKLMSLYAFERAQEHTLVPAIYHSHAAFAVRKRNEELYRLQFHPGTKNASTKGGWKVEPQLMIEFLGILTSAQPPEELLKAAKMAIEETPKEARASEKQESSDEKTTPKRDGSDLEYNSSSSKKRKVLEDNSSAGSLSTT